MNLHQFWLLWFLFVISTEESESKNSSKKTTFLFWNIGFMIEQHFIFVEFQAIFQMKSKNVIFYLYYINKIYIFYLFNLFIIIFYIINMKLNSKSVNFDFSKNLNQLNILKYHTKFEYHWIFFLNIFWISHKSIENSGLLFLKSCWLLIYFWFSAYWYWYFLI